MGAKLVCIQIYFLFVSMQLLQFCSVFQIHFERLFHLEGEAALVDIFLFVTGTEITSVQYKT